MRVIIDFKRCMATVEKLFLGGKTAGVSFDMKWFVLQKHQFASFSYFCTHVTLT